jgi:hypothetical protein
MRRLDRHRLALQPDLFRPIPPTLEWRQLPSDVRRKATELMARMLREHRGAAAEAAGGRDNE